MNIRKATMNDLDEITAIEAICFPASEAANQETFASRLTVYANYFWLLEEDNKIIAFINGMVINEETIRDEMFANPAFHDEKGKWLAIFGVDTLPEYQHQGLASKVMRAVIKEAKETKRLGCVLTCKEQLIPFYEQFGYVNCGVSASVHGGAKWYDMKLIF